MSVQTQPFLQPNIRTEPIRTFKDVLVLAGFMDDIYFKTFGREHLAELNGPETLDLLSSVSTARTLADRLEPIELADVELGLLDERNIQHIECDPLFQAAYSAVPYRFSWIDPQKLVSVQASRHDGHGPVPTEEPDLIEFALPTDWSVPAEFSFVPPAGPIYITSNSPQVTGYNLSVDPATGQILVGTNRQINLIQVVRFQDRYYLRNGYHRVVDALAAGQTRLPALVTDAHHMSAVAMNHLGLAAFDVQTSMEMSRPPLVRDFLSEVAVKIKMRMRRYGVAITLQATPLLLPV